jgi:hypothetical protein
MPHVVQWMPAFASQLPQNVTLTSAAAIIMYVTLFVNLTEEQRR